MPSDPDAHNHQTAVDDGQQPTQSTSALDLSPRELAGAGRRSGRRWMPILLIVGVLVAGGVIMTQFLTSAVDYYCNVDEVGERSGCDADRRLRVQGVVEEGSVSAVGARTDFTIEFNGAALPVTYDGEPGGIFKECLPVVVHGELDSASGVFVGDRIEVKHSDNYVAVNSDRLDEADDLSADCSTATSA